MKSQVFFELLTGEYLTKDHLPRKVTPIFYLFLLSQKVVDPTNCHIMDNREIRWNGT